LCPDHPAPSRSTARVQSVVNLARTGSRSAMSGGASGNR
jgi:hypothetical protein